MSFSTGRARRWALAAALAVAFACGGSPAEAQAAGAAPRVVVAEALALVQAKQAQAAYDRLKPLEPRYGGDPEFDYVLGLAALDSGRPGEAVGILTRVVERRPDLLPAKAELGRAYLTLGDLPAARQIFASLSGDQRLPPKVRDVIGNYITDIDRVMSPNGSVVAPGTTRFGGFVEFRAGYDSNVNSATSATEILIPAFAFLGPAQISPQGRARPAWFGELAVGLSMVHALTAIDAVYANIVGAGKFNHDESQFDSVILGAELGYVHDFGPQGGRLAVALVGQSYLLDPKNFTFDSWTYRDAVGTSAVWTRTTPGGLSTTGYATYLHLNYDGDAKRNANRFVVGTTIGQRFASAGDLFLFGTLQGGTEQATSELTAHYSYNLFTARVGMELPIAPNVSVFANGGVEWRDYDAPFPLFLVSRFDHEFAGALGLDWRFGNNMRLRPTLTYVRTISNVALFDQSRWVAAVALRKEF